MPKLIVPFNINAPSNFSFPIFWNHPIASSQSNPVSTNADLPTLPLEDPKKFPKKPRDLAKNLGISLDVKLK